MWGLMHLDTNTPGSGDRTLLIISLSCAGQAEQFRSSGQAAVSSSRQELNLYSLCGEASEGSLQHSGLLMAGSGKGWGTAAQLWAHITKGSCLVARKTETRFFFWATIFLDGT